MPQRMNKRSKKQAKHPTPHEGTGSGRSGREMRENKVPERTCLVTRETKPEDQLIRFVVSPDTQVVPDIKRKLPGRGVWVSATHVHLEAAVKKGLFARGFGAKVSVADDLVDVTGGLLRKDALSLLSLANRAGLVTSGFEKVAASVVKQQIAAIVAACDASDDGKNKIAARARAAGQEVKHIRIFTSDEISLALGRTNVVHAALMLGGLADSLVRAVEKLERFCE